MIPTAEMWPPTIELRRGAESVAAHLAALRAVLAAEVPESYRTGRGIVTVGGGKYWPGIVVMAKLLRESGCKLPVQVWHRGDIEPVREADVRGLGVQVIDATALAIQYGGDNRIAFNNEWRGGWEMKLYAISHTLFEEVLFLDADAYCVADPAPLFDLLVTAPFVFWSDLPQMDGCVKWPMVWPDGGGSAPTVQGGQLLIDTVRARRLLAVAHWLCQHSDYYFAHLYGDQDAWRVALAAGRYAHLCLGPAPWRDVGFVLPFEGREMIVHRCQSKLFRCEEPRRCDALPLESRVFDLLAQSAS